LTRQPVAASGGRSLSAGRRTQGGNSVETTGHSADYSASLLVATLWAPILALPPILFLIGLNAWIWGPSRILSWVADVTTGSRTSDPGLLLWLLVVLVAVVLHEFLHGLGWALCSHRPVRSVVEFGVRWRALTPFARCKAEVPLKVYRAGTVLPALLLGLLPATAGLITGDGRALAFGSLMILAAGGDLLVLWLVRSVPGDRLAQDHPTRVGCYILDPPASEP